MQCGMTKALGPHFGDLAWCIEVKAFLDHAQLIFNWLTSVFQELVTGRAQVLMGKAKDREC